MENNPSKNIRDDLILFKNETLRDIKEQEKILIEKYRNLEFTIIEKIENFDKKFLKFTNKMIEISSFIDSLKDVKNNINVLMQHKSKTENSLIDLDIKLRSSNRDNLNSFNNIYTILKDSVIYPGIIGSSTKFKTFHDFIDYILAHIAYVKQFKETITKEVNNNKSYQDNHNEKIRNQIEVIIEKTNVLISNEIASSEDRIHSILKLHEEKMQNMRIEHSKNYNNVKKDMEESDNMLKEEINEKNKDLFTKYNELNEKNNQYNNEIKSLKEKYTNLNETITEMNYKIENGELLQLNNQIDINDRRKNKENERGLSYRNFSANDQNFRVTRLMRNERGYKNDNKNYNQIQSIKNIINNKTIESYYNESKDEYDYNKILNFWGKSQSFRRFPLYNKDNNMMIENKKYFNMITNNNVNRSNYYNSYSNINTIKNNKELDNSYKLKTSINLSDKGTYVNLNSNHKFKRTKQLKNISLNIEGNKEDLIIKNINIKNALKNSPSILNNKKTSKKNNNYSGYPRIITNQGERIIVSSHPVYHRDKFTHNINPNIFFTYKNKKFYNNNEKGNYMKSSNNIIKNINKKNNKEKNIDNKNNDKDTINDIDDNDNEDLYNTNSIFKTLLNPKNTNKEKKKVINNGRNNSYQNYKKNKDYIVLTYNDNTKKKTLKLK